MSDFRLPNTTQRTGVFGSTGTGKTRMGTWLLSEAPFDKVPYTVLDYKGEALFAQTDKIKQIDLDYVPKHPGLYIMRPGADDDNAVEAWFRKIHERENCGTYIDEGYGINRNSPAFRNVLVQGRSKNLPVIFLSQRPAWISPYMVSEASFLAIFPLTKPEDRKKVCEIVPGDPFERLDDLPPFHSYWYDVAARTGFNMLPVPSDDDILNKIEDRLRTKKGRL